MTIPRRASLVLVLALVAPARLHAQYEKFVRFEAARVTTERSRQGAAFGLRLGGAILHTDALRFEVGGWYSRINTGFFTLDAGVEARAVGPALAAFVGAGAGLYGELESGLLVRATAGVEARLGFSSAVRVAVQASRHEGQPGPSGVLIGLEWRM